MAGRIKHMQRSHRSHRKHDGVFNDFHRKAYIKLYDKQQKLTLGQRLAQMLKPVKESIRRAAN